MQKSTTKLITLMLIGAMMIFLVSILAGETYALTKATAASFGGGLGPSFSNIKWHLDAGKWVQTPVSKLGWIIDWTTKGSGFFGGDERGRILADLGWNRHVTFSWSNPNSGNNTCNVQWAGDISSARCKITQGPIAAVEFMVFTR